MKNIIAHVCMMGAPQRNDSKKRKWHSMLIINFNVRFSSQI